MKAIKVRCIDDRGFGTHGLVVVKGGIYEAIEAGPDRYYLVGDTSSNPRGVWTKNRFEVLDENVSIVLSKKPLFRECPCGIVRVDCSYHKED